MRAGEAGRAYRAPQARHLHARSQHHEFRRPGRDQHAAQRAQDGRRDARRRRDAGARTVRHRRLPSGARPDRRRRACRGRGCSRSCSASNTASTPSPETMLYARNLLPHGRDLDRLRHRPRRVPDGGAGLAARRPCARRHGGQPLYVEGRAGQEQCRTCDARGGHLQSLGAAIATPAEARALLGLS